MIRQIRRDHHVTGGLVAAQFDQGRDPVKRRGASRKQKDRRLTARPKIRIAKENEAGRREELWKEWEKEMQNENWDGAIQTARRSTKQFPKEYFGWENLAWGLHRAGRTRAAYRILAPLLKGLKLPPSPSGRAAYFLACFSSMLGKGRESERWFRLALALAVDPKKLVLDAMLQAELSPLKGVLETILRESRI